MRNDTQRFDRYLRVMHACEKGATGVYWGHRAVAAVLFRDLVPDLSRMHAHEMEHYALFGTLIKQKRTRRVLLPVVWCAGGIVYGFLTALFGRRAVWKSTAVIEAIVEKELLEAAEFFRERDSEVYGAIHRILLDELEHKEQGLAASADRASADALIESIAAGGAAAAKKLAEKL